MSTDATRPAAPNGTGRKTSPQITPNGMQAKPMTTMVPAAAVSLHHIMPRMALTAPKAATTNHADMMTRKPIMAALNWLGLVFSAFILVFSTIVFAAIYACYACWIAWSSDLKHGLAAIFIVLMPAVIGTIAGSTVVMRRLLEVQR